jgi:hypothetical protein
VAVGLTPEGHPRAQAANARDPTATEKAGDAVQPRADCCICFHCIERKRARKTCKKVYKYSDSVCS